MHELKLKEVSGKPFVEKCRKLVRQETFFYIFVTQRIQEKNFIWIVLNLYIEQTVTFNNK